MSQTIQFRDASLRDGQQSLFATRMTTAQSLPLLKLIDQAGFPFIEAWGGATLDSCIRYLNEDPWERLEAFKVALGSNAHKIQALLRGQNLFGYQPYADDLVIAFIKQAIESGVGVMRIFDSLNDVRNLQIPILACKAYGTITEAAISYTTSPVHTNAYFVELAQKLAAEGVDRIAIKDMAGILHPLQALPFFKALRQAVNLPISLHSHDTAGVGSFNALLAMMHGLDTIDTCITPFASATSHPPVELMIVFAEALGLDHQLDKALILKIQAELFATGETLKEFNPYWGKYYRPVTYEGFSRQTVDQIITLAAKGDTASLNQALQLTRALLIENGYPEFDDRMFEAQIPGGMITNLQSQLKALGQLDALPEVIAEIPRVRAEAGYPPLVTPTSQIIGSQATFNVLTGERYLSVSNEFKMLLRGEFGKTPAKIDAGVLRKVLGDDEARQVYRPASYLKPALEHENQFYYVVTQKERLLHHMLGKSADDFLKKRHEKAVQKLDDLLDGVVAGI